MLKVVEQLWEANQLREIVIVTAKVEDNWRVQAGQQSFELSIKQEFQAIKVAAQIGNRRVPLRRTRLQGDQMSSPHNSNARCCTSADASKTTG